MKTRQPSGRRLFPSKNKGGSMVIFLGVIGAAILLVFAVLVIRQTFIGVQILKATIQEPSTNNDDLAVGSFTDLLEKARSDMMVYDDGNEMEGSVYMQQEVIDAVKKKLRDAPNFIIRCYFNCDEKDTLFRQAFDSEKRVEIRTGTGTRPDDTHYKIIDDGRLAYLSQHGHGDSERKFQVVDCTGVNPLVLKIVTDSLLGEYKKDIEKKFPSRLAS
jgi:hypothetical protein